MGSTLDRREFLKLGAVSAGAAISCRDDAEEVADPTDPQPMRYRPLGGTGLSVSEVSFGAHGVDNAALMAAALEAGVNTFCTSGGYLDGREESALGEALAKIGPPRDEIVILSGAGAKPGDTVQTWLDGIDASLQRLRTDHLDVFYNAMVQTPDQVRSEVVLEGFERAKKAGKIHHLGVSGHHGGLQDCLEAALDIDAYEVFFTKYDFVSYPDQDDLLRRASERGIGTLVFKTDAGSRQREIEDLEAGGLSFRQATIRWALTNRDVASVSVTMTTFDTIAEATGAVGSGLSGNEVAMLKRYAEEMYDQYCRFCATCEASCPHQVAVADIMRYAMYFNYYGREKEAMRLYSELAGASTAAPCRTCSAPCDGGCPFGRSVQAGLVEAHESLRWDAAKA